MKSKDQIILAVELALKAGKEIMRIYNTPEHFAIETKSDSSPVTAADKKAHSVIVTGLAEYSDLPVISEEGEIADLEERNSWTHFWLIDPLDGTKEFIKRNGDFTVNIALIKDQKPFLGIVYTPVHETLYVGEVGVGAWKLDNISIDNYSSKTLERKKPLPLKSSHTPYTVLLSRSHMTPETEEWVQNKRKSKPELATIHAGSSLKSCIIAEGNAHIHPRLGNTMEWDTAAAHAVVQAAGKNIVDFHSGEPLKYNTETLVNPWFIVQ